MPSHVFTPHFISLFIRCCGVRVWLSTAAPPEKGPAPEPTTHRETKFRQMLDRSIIRAVSLAALKRQSDNGQWIGLIEQAASYSCCCMHNSFIGPRRLRTTDFVTHSLTRSLHCYLCMRFTLAYRVLLSRLVSFRVHVLSNNTQAFQKISASNLRA